MIPSAFSANYILCVSLGRAHVFIVFRYVPFCSFLLGGRVMGVIVGVVLWGGGSQIYIFFAFLSEKETCGFLVLLPLCARSQSVSFRGAVFLRGFHQRGHHQQISSTNKTTISLFPFFTLSMGLRAHVAQLT